MIIEIPDSLAAAIQDIQIEGGHLSMDETVVCALSTLLWIRDQQLKGLSVGALSKDKLKFHELIPFTKKSIHRWLDQQ